MKHFNQLLLLSQMRQFVSRHKTFDLFDSSPPPQIHLAVLDQNKSHNVRPVRFYTPSEYGDGWTSNPSAPKENPEPGFPLQCCTIKFFEREIVIILQIYLYVIQTLVKCFKKSVQLFAILLLL